MDDSATSPDDRTAGETFEDVAARGLTRRALVERLLGAAFVVHLPRVEAWPIGPGPVGATALAFAPIAGSTEDRLVVAAGHRVDVLLRWGEPVLAGAPAFEPEQQSAAAQAQQFGYNCDFVGFLPLPSSPRASDRGLLVVNHEYTNPELMFAGFDLGAQTAEQVAIQLAAQGMSVVEVRRGMNGRWRALADGPFNRRVTATTPCTVTGPAAGTALLRTRDDPSGRLVLGTLANCSAGRTPWGTVLSAEENFHEYFGNLDRLPEGDPRLRLHARYGMSKRESKWRFEQHDRRFDVRREPNEAFRFGWVVELDPYDPTWVPRKRTALGRLHREAANSVVATTGQVVLYSGDDTPFEYVFKFVTRQAWNPIDRTANRDLLDDGVLHVARFDPDGTGHWVPLRAGKGQLVGANGFYSQADVVISPLLAADAVSATRMDRPEDIEISPVDGKVYVALTKNELRGAPDQLRTDSSNPRAINKYGHIIEIVEADGNHAATTFAWRIFMLCGDPDDASTYFAGYPRDRVSAIACPDNLAFDRAGNLWVATDGQPGALAINDGLYAVPTSGPERGYIRRFLSAVPGAEVTGPDFTPDDRSLFLSIQHPGEGSTLAAPTSRWPDGHGPPRPSVVVITAEDGSPVGRGA